MPSVLANNRLLVRAVWAAKMRHLARDSRSRGDDPTKDSDVVGLTAAQSLFTEQDDESLKTSLNTIGGALVIDEPVDVDLLRQTVNKIRKNNDGMRLRFVERNGVLRQYAAAYEPLNTALVHFPSEEELKQFCDAQIAEPYGDLRDKDLSHEIHVFQLGDGRGGIVFRDAHARQDASSIGLVGAYVLDIYEHLLHGDREYEGAKTSFIAYARTSKSIGSLAVKTTDDVVDTTSTRSVFTLDSAATSHLKRLCKRASEEARLNIRPSKVFELANAVLLGRRRGNAQSVVLQNLRTGREPGTPDEFTIGLYMNSRPETVRLDWKESAQANLIDMKRRAKGILNEPPYLDEGDPSETVWISFRTNPAGLRSLFRTPFHAYEAPRKHSTVPLLMSIEDMNESGEYQVIYDYWNSHYTTTQIADRHKEILAIIHSILSSPKTPLEELSARL